MISVDQGYLVRNVVSTKVMVVIIPQFLYCVVSNHTVTGSTTVATFTLRLSFFFFFVRCRDLLDLYIVYSVVSLQLTELSMHCIFYLTALYADKCQNF